MCSDRPNVLLVCSDQHRRDWLGALGHPVRTRAIDRLADRGVQFSNAICPAPWCGPSRAALATGMEYDRCGVPDHDTDLPLDRTTMYGRLREEAGYRTLGVGVFDLAKATDREWADADRRLDAYGFDDGVICGGYTPGLAYGRDSDCPPDPYIAYLRERDLLEAHVADRDARDSQPVWSNFVDTEPTPLPDEAYLDNWIGRRGLDLLEDALGGDEPWFLSVFFNGPHPPMDVTERMHGWYRDPPVEFPLPDDVDSAHDAATHHEIRRNYAAKIEAIDRWLDRYVGAIDRGGALEETLVVYASDHGELLGDHGEWTKRSPYRESAGIPMVVAGPGVRSREPVETPASLIDLHATVLDYAGLAPGDVDARSMRPVLTGETDAHREIAFCGLGPWRAVFDDRHELVLGFDPDRSTMVTREDDQVNPFFDRTDGTTWAEVAVDTEPVLFEYPSDPVTDVADEHPETIRRLATALVETVPCDLPLDRLLG